MDRDPGLPTIQVFSFLRDHDVYLSVKGCVYIYRDIHIHKQNKTFTYVYSYMFMHVRASGTAEDHDVLLRLGRQ